jgi:hypothetical protein
MKYSKTPNQQAHEFLSIATMIIFPQPIKYCFKSIEEAWGEEKQIERTKFGAEFKSRR